MAHTIALLDVLTSLAYLARERRYVKPYVADNIEIRNIKSVKIKVDKRVKFKLLYDKNNSLTKKILIEKIRKEIS